MPDQEAVNYVNRMILLEVSRERERCALLCEMQGYHALAADIRRGAGYRVHRHDRSSDYNVEVMDHDE